MLESIWNSLSQASGQRWARASLTPAFLVWIASVWSQALWWGLPQTWSWWEKLGDAGRTLFFLALATLIVLTAFALDLVGATILAWCEGNWDNLPLVGKWMHRTLSRWQVRKVTPLRQRREELHWKELAREYPPEHDLWVGRQRPETISSEEDRELLRLDKELHDWPSDDKAMPTRLGNVLQAAEQHAILRYGLDPVVTWARLHHLLPEGLRANVDDARTALDAVVRSAFAAAIFAAGWGIAAISSGVALVSSSGWGMAVLRNVALPLLAAIGGGLAVWLGWRAALRAASIYGELLRAAFDLHRLALYEALHWPSPTDSNTEAEKGRELTAFLWRGPDVLRPKGMPWIFESPQTPSKPPAKR